LGAFVIFDSAKQKIERANHHMADIEGQFAAFIASKPHRFVIERDDNTGTMSMRIELGKQLPGTFALIIGDAIHNLRCALDHVAWELADIGKGAKNRRTKFVISGSNRVDFEALCEAIETPSQWVKDAIKATEAFPSGKGHDLFELNEFDNADKHHVITPILRGTTHPPFTIRTPQGGIIRMEGNVFIGGTDAVNIGLFPRGTIIDVHNNNQCAPGIFLRKANGRLEPVNALLWGLREAVMRAITSIEAAIPV